MTNAEIDEVKKACAAARTLGRQEMRHAVLSAWNERSKVEQATSPNKEGWYALNRLWHVIAADGFGEKTEAE